MIHPAPDPSEISDEIALGKFVGQCTVEHISGEGGRIQLLLTGPGNEPYQLDFAGRRIRSMGGTQIALTNTDTNETVYKD